MAEAAIKYARLICLFGLGCLLFSYPMIGLFNTRQIILGAPLLYCYLFGVWAILIFLAWIITHFSKGDQGPNSPKGN
jgi:hypothetical protein